MAYLAWAYLLALVGLFGGVMLHLYLTQRCFGYLDERHPNAFRGLGEPNLFLNNSIKTNIAFARFVRTGEYLRLNDITLTKLIRRRRLVSRIVFVSMVLSITGMVWQWTI